MSEEKKIPTIEDMKEEALKFAQSIPNLEEKRKFMAEIRGMTIEFSIIVERCFNQLISATGKEMVFDYQKKELHLIKGIRTKKDIPKFKTKSRDMTKLIENIFTSHGENPPQEIFDKFNRFEALRDVFAHVPINWNAQNLEFIDDGPYKHFFKDHRWKNILLAHSEFVGLFQWIIDAILAYNRNILLKKEILSLVLLGKSQAEIQKEAEKPQNEQNTNNKAA